MTRSVTLVKIETPEFFSRITADLAADGSLSVEGQDLGKRVEEFWGEGQSEYEWSYTLGPDAVAALKAALGGQEVLAALAERFSGDQYSKLRPFMESQGIEFAFWSRVGD